MNSNCGQARGHWEAQDILSETSQSPLLTLATTHSQPVQLLVVVFLLEFSILSCTMG